MTLTGRIIKATGGFYYVAADGRAVECRARGIFRKNAVTPYVGDIVDIVLDQAGSGTVSNIHERRNFLIRPPLANIDCMALVLSVSDPVPNLLVVDKFLAVLEHKNIPAIIALTKSDIEDAAELASLYRKAGYEVFIASPPTGEGVDALSARISGNLCAFSGNSGVGKSSLLNALDPRLDAPTGLTSKKLGRGRHTTRHVELFPLPNGGMVADTPGFSAMDIVRMSDLRTDFLAGCFRDFEPFIGKCRFLDCAHIHERGCAVLEAENRGNIAQSRHQSYVQLYNDLKDIKEWEQKA